MTSSKTRSAPARRVACAQLREVALVGLLDVHGLQHDGRELPGVGAEQGMERTQVVVGETVGQHGHGPGHALVAGGGADIPVLPAVVAADSDAVAPGEGAREAHGGRGCVGAVLAEAHLLGAGNDLHQPLGQIRLEGGGEAEADAALELGRDGAVHVPRRDSRGRRAGGP